MACLQEMLPVNMRQNLQIVNQISTKYSDILGPVKLIEMFEGFKTFEGACFHSFDYDPTDSQMLQVYTNTLVQL